VQRCWQVSYKLGVSKRAQRGVFRENFTDRSATLRNTDTRSARGRPCAARARRVPLPEKALTPIIKNDVQAIPREDCDLRCGFFSDAALA
jgi:hypothetical protein